MLIKIENQLIDLEIYGKYMRKPTSLWVNKYQFKVKNKDSSFSVFRAIRHYLIIMNYERL